LLRIASKTVGDNYYKAFPLWKTQKGRQSYIDWLNHREKRWEAHQARLDKRDPAPREYAGTVGGIGVTPRLNYLENDVENFIVKLPIEDVDLLVNEAQELLKSDRGKADYDNWLKHRDAGLLILRHKRRNV
jgi:hypothetical protein